MMIEDRDQWLKQRIEWRAGKHSLFNRQCLRFDNLPAARKQQILNATELKGLPVLAFTTQQSQPWTALTTREVLSTFEGRLHVVDLERIDKKVGLKHSNSSDPQLAKTTSSILTLDAVGEEIWAPSGEEIFALMNILRMFPLRYRRS